MDYCVGELTIRNLLIHILCEKNSLIRFRSAGAYSARAPRGPHPPGPNSHLSWMCKLIGPQTFVYMEVGSPGYSVGYESLVDSRFWAVS